MVNKFTFKLIADDEYTIVPSRYRYASIYEQKESISYGKIEKLIRSRRLVYIDEKKSQLVSINHKN